MPSHSPLSFFSLLALVALLFSATFGSASPVEKRSARTSPPSGAVVVNVAGGSGVHTTVSSAVAALPNDNSARTIFIYPGTYNEQVFITRPGMTTIYGYTTNNLDHAQNVVNIKHSASASAAGGDDPSGTLRVHKDNFAMYNVNVYNTFGQGQQAIAVSAYGSKQGYYACGFYGYQDTLLAEQGTQFYGYTYIQGAVDYVFGQHAFAFFQSCTLASSGPGSITAAGPSSSSDGIYVINKATIEVAPGTGTSLAGKVYLGRPWSQFARVVYTNSNIGAHVNALGWDTWSSASPNTAHVLFAEFGSSGAGAAGKRASFSKKLSSAAGYTISDVLGSSHTWVDSGYDH
ncbi:unnamed protein product [Mycena citricolor]|uniref:Pectinesterase n=1 Tax=Mycena citricolor TaxID=2018698 RepID=A0AAD2JXJ0_9AGAR|nr:unnamed protein product [Mycena citricolor]